MQNAKLNSHNLINHNLIIVNTKNLLILGGFYFIYCLEL